MVLTPEKKNKPPAAAHRAGVVMAGIVQTPAAVAVEVVVPPLAAHVALAAATANGGQMPPVADGGTGAVIGLSAPTPCLDSWYPASAHLILMPSALVSEWQLKQKLVPVCAVSRDELHAESPSTTRHHANDRADLMSVSSYGSWPAVTASDRCGTWSS